MSSVARGSPANEPASDPPIEYAMPRTSSTAATSRATCSGSTVPESSVEQLCCVGVGATGEIATELEHREPQERFSLRGNRIALSYAGERQRVSGVAEPRDQLSLLGRWHVTPTTYERFLHFRCRVVGEGGVIGESVHGTPSKEVGVPTRLPPGVAAAGSVDCGVTVARPRGAAMSYSHHRPSAERFKYLCPFPSPQYALISTTTPGPPAG